MNFFAALVWITGWNAAAQAPPAPAGKPQQQILRSALLEEDRRILIRLPRHYQADSSVRYPVLYKFDGDNQLDSYDHAIEVLNNLDAIPDLIVVAIPNGRGARNRDLTPPSLHQEDGVDGGMGKGEMGRGDRFLDFIERELIPYIDTNYRTTSERLLAGHSRGALIVLQSLLSKPGLFQGRFMISAPLMRDEQRLIVETRKFLQSNRDHGSFLYCNWGEAENEGMNRSHSAFLALLKKEAPRNLRWTVERARAANHQQTQPAAIPSALRDYFAGRPPGSNQNNRTVRETSAATSR